MKLAHFCSSWTPSGNIWSSVGWSICAQDPVAGAGAEAEVVGVGADVGAWAMISPPAWVRQVEARPGAWEEELLQFHSPMSTYPPLPWGGDGGFV